MVQVVSHGTWNRLVHHFCARKTPSICERKSSKTTSQLIRNHHLGQLWVPKINALTQEGPVTTVANDNPV